MREIKAINSDWAFLKGDTKHHKVPKKAKKKWETVNLPTHGMHWMGRTAALTTIAVPAGILKKLKYPPNPANRFSLKFLQPRFRQRFILTKITFAHIREAFQPSV